TFASAAENPRIVEVKYAKLDLEFSSSVMAETGLAFYCGTDSMTLPLLSVGGIGVVGTSTHVSGVGAKAMIEAYERGDVAEALRLHRQLLPIFTGIFKAQGVVLVKAALTLLGRPAGSVRPPLLDADDHEISHLRQDLHAAGLLTPEQAALITAH
ncbi:MAG: dapA, partial [Jatrophihabitantaceae bacterium]|nr:dapA [Jatrophihabitantaceae bacterium]